MDDRTLQAVLIFKEWLFSREEPPLKSDVEWEINYLANWFCTDRKSFDRIVESLNQVIIGGYNVL